jgi:predicted flap endonuclease-1-like 5' DNA nuclease
MTYLLAKLWLPLLIAFALGCVGGYAGRKKFGSLWGSAVFRLVAVLALILSIIGIVKLVPGRPGFWVEIAALACIAYLVGWIIGYIVRGRSPAKVEMPAPAPVMATPAAVVAAPVVAAKPVAVPTPAPAPAVANESSYAGSRPAGLASARGGKADDLKLIKGVGKQNEARLHGLGIWHFDQVAAWNSKNIEWVGAYLAFPGRIDRENWVAQAKVLAKGGETEFATRAKAGKVATSRDDGTKGSSNIETPIKVEKPVKKLATTPAAKSASKPVKKS